MIQPKPALAAAQWVAKWAGFCGVVGHFLRSKTAIAVTMGVEHDRQNLPLRFSDPLYDGICEAIPKTVRP